MKRLMRAAMLALTGVATVLTFAAGSALATDPPSSSAAQTSPADPAAVSKTPDASTRQGASATEDRTGVGERGQLEDMMSFCDVAPPCPSGCTVDAVSHKCTEWPGP
jgi:hypothetical protein